MKLQDLDKISGNEPSTLIPEGAYVVTITDAEEKVSSKGNPMIELQAEISAGEYRGRGLRDWIVYTEAAAWKMRQVLDAVQIEIPEGEFELKAASLIGRQAAVQVAHVPYQDRMTTKIERWSEIELDDDRPKANEDVDVPF